MTTSADPPPPATSRFRVRAEAAALAWKRSTITLPDDARVPAPYVTDHGPVGRYDVCIPPEHAALSLLPDVRAAALTLFASEGIKWHAGTIAGPSNHLLDSQVQCVNALAPGVDDPNFVRDLFKDTLPIAQVLEIEPARYLTFEYIGATDHLREARGPRTRGSMTTSADAAIRYQTLDGGVEIALIEWKFTEDYRSRELRQSRRPRPEIYREFWDAVGKELRRDVLPYEDLFVEPFYQLLRQQLLAASMERTAELDASRVCVVHVCPKENEGVHGALNRPSHRVAGDDTITVWASIAGSRFLQVDATAKLHQLRSSEYLSRYTVL